MSKRKQKQALNSDSKYFLKLVTLVILGSLWLKINRGSAWQLPLPVGLIGGIYLVSKDKAKQDRKLGYAVLLIAMLVGFWAPIGLFINV